MAAPKLKLVHTSNEVMEHRVAQLEDGYMRLANDLLEATMCSGLPETELCIVMAVWRKTYGYSKKLDWVSNEQLGEMIDKHPTHCSTAKNNLIRKKVLIQEGRKVGMNTNISEWETKNNGFRKTLAEVAKKTLAEPAKQPKQNLLNTKDNIQNTKDNTPLNPPEGVEVLALSCLDYYNQLAKARCSSAAPFEKALSTVKAKGVCYSVDEVNLVVRWALTCWKSRKTLPKPNNICTMTRFDGYLSDALVWAEGGTQNPMPCPHEELIAIWNEKFPTKAVAVHEWNRRRPAYGNLEAVWNGKTNSGNWREARHIGTAFDLIRQSSLFASAETKPWLTLDWILTPKNWGQVYEQAINEHRQRKGAIA